MDLPALRVSPCWHRNGQRGGLRPACWPVASPDRPVGEPVFARTDNGTDSQVDEQGENIMPPLQAIQPAEHLVHKISPGAVIGRNKQ